MKNKIPITKELITIDKDQGLTEAMALMDKENISHLLVRDEGNIIGLVTQRDIANKLANPRDLGTERKLRATQFHVSSAMIKDLKTISSDREITDAAKMMIENKISSLPVVENNKIIGIVTKTDLIRKLKNSKKEIEIFYNKNSIKTSMGSTIVHTRKIMLECGVHRLLVTHQGRLEGILTEKDIAIGFQKFRRALDKYKHADVRSIKVEDVMTRDPVTITKNAVVSDAVKIMLEHGISGIPVVAESLGILTKTDLVRGIAEGNLP